MHPTEDWFEYHLTPNGWIKGSEKIEFSAPVIVEPPPDRVVTRVYKEAMLLYDARMDLSMKVTWQSADTELVNRLLGQYPDAPHRQF